MEALYGLDSSVVWTQNCIFKLDCSFWPETIPVFCWQDKFCRGNRRDTRTNAVVSAPTMFGTDLSYVVALCERRDGGTSRHGICCCTVRPNNGNDGHIFV